MHEPTELLSTVVDVNGLKWTRYPSDPDRLGHHWWSPLAGWRAFRELSVPTQVPARVHG